MDSPSKVVWSLIGVVVLFFGFLSYQELWADTDPRPSLSYAQVAGTSMSPTFQHGDLVEYSDAVTPKVGDVIQFTCNTVRCISANKRIPGETHPQEELIKRISAINGDCYTVLGDNPDQSLDSRHFGELCGPDITIHGVVTGIVNR